MEWEEQHWSGRKDRTASHKPRLKPNAFARLARFAAGHSLAVLGVFLALSLVAAGLAAMRLTVDPDASPEITFDPQTAAAQAALARHFPGIDEAFSAMAVGEDGAETRARALAVAAALEARADLFDQAFVPGAGPFYDRFGLLFQPQADIIRKVAQIQSMQPLYLALAASPDLQGLAVLVSEIGKAVEAGRSPPGLAGVLNGASSTIEAEIAGVSAPFDWVTMAGLAPGSESRRWFVIAQPAKGKSRLAAAYAQQVSAQIEGITWLWPRKALGESVNLMRDFVVPGGLAVVAVLTLLAAGLGAFRYAMPVVAAALVTLFIAAGVAAVFAPALDGTTWAFAAPVVAPAAAMSIAMVIQYSEARLRGAGTRQAVMLAGQRSGGMQAAIAGVFLAFWLTWLLRQIPSLTNFAIIAGLSSLVALMVSLALTPAMLALSDDGESEPIEHWADAALAGPAGNQGRGILQAVGMVILAAGVFCAMFLPKVKFGERLTPLDPPAVLESLDARGAVHVLSPPGDEAQPMISALSALPETGSIRWIGQFLPIETQAKLLYLKQLDGVFAEPSPPAAPGDQQVIAPAFAMIEAGLRQIADGQAADDELRAAADRMRRAVGLFTSPEPPSPGRVLALEDALFSRLGHLPRAAAGLAEMTEPAVADLDPPLRRRFVGEDGLWRIEVMPKPGVGTLSFAAAVRKAAPNAAGEPIAALSRNEVMHHEAALAFAAALMAAVVLSFAALRDPARWIITVPVAAVSATFAAAALTGFGIAVNSTMLAAASCAAAVSVSTSMLFADGVKVKYMSAGAAVRAGVLPAIVLLGAVLPLTLSTRSGVAEFGFVLSLFLLIIALVNALLPPVLSLWLYRARLL